MDTIDSLRTHLNNLLTKAEAHVDALSTIQDFPRELRGRKPNGSPHTPWQLLEHMRIAQWDIVRFTLDPQHVSPKWPDEYWPKASAPATDKAWDESVLSFKSDLNEMVALVKNKKHDLFAPFLHGDGQTLLREALLLADHNAYHLGQLVLLRRMLEAE